MRISVIGATLGVGLALTNQARAAGHAVTAVGRSLPASLSPDLIHVQGTIEDPEVARRAVEGADAVAWCAGGHGFGPAFLKRVDWISRGTTSLIDAMRAEGVRRLAVVTGIGAGDSWGHGGALYDRLLLPLAVGALYADKDRQEAIVRASDLDWTIVRPGFLIDEPPRRRYGVHTDLTGLVAGPISRSDVADCLLRCLVDGEWLRETILICDSRTMA
ncbi:NAD(P)-dependent oxidoreductase [Salinarimonas soli]|uniref:NAD(P)H-binding protein n=1 Tax=Salinarimonas soli TaxID=1638099 RepID=A0A5B2VTW5_9HYPH|nr:NAD(P)H-binding protein [Salinarimonas soli]KAA2242224.1 NAD(P)H-binding protein [Salinarimonas soli]